MHEHYVVEDTRIRRRDRDSIQLSDERLTRPCAARPGHSAGSVDVGAAALATGGTSGLTMVQQRDVVVTRARSQTVAIGGDKLRITRGFAASAASEQQTLSEVVARAKDCALNKDSSTSVLSALAERAMQSASELTPAQIRDLTVSFAKLGYFNTAFKSAMADTIIARCVGVKVKRGGVLGVYRHT